MDEWIEKMCIYIQWYIIQPKKKKNLAFTTTWIDLKVK